MTIQKHNALNDVVEAACPACGFQIAVPFYHGGYAPLTTQAWPTSKAEANQMERLPLNFVSCIDCTHIFNFEFSYDKVPYNSKPNLMYNNGQTWQTHLEQTQALILAHLPKTPTIIEIGTGDGHFIKALATQLNNSGQFYAFDPNGQFDSISSDRSNPQSIQFFAHFFDPSIHINSLYPDIIIARHLLEHLENPLSFIQHIAFYAGKLDKPVYLFLEVPCIDKAIRYFRTEDFFYEHYSHFSERSFKALFNRSQLSPAELSTGYKNEVIYAIAPLKKSQKQSKHHRLASLFCKKARQTDSSIQEQLHELVEANQRVAIWGGTGKAAAFINRYSLDADRFPVVVDSDPYKHGTYVPGTGQCIQSPDVLLKTPVDCIVIATQWRTQDIALEIESRKINVLTVLAENDGKLDTVVVAKPDSKTDNKTTAKRFRAERSLSAVKKMAKHANRITQNQRV
ncbi:MAG: class I SAM-dependent methyltransferase [Cyanobacteria bacterium P01_H01_bin.74]